MSARPRIAPSVNGVTAASLDFRLLGPVELWSHSRKVDLGPAESAKVRCLLAVLLRTPGVPVPTETLLDRVWGDRPAGTAARYKYVGWLRAALAPYGVPLEQDNCGYRLCIDAERVDLHRFRRLIGEATTAIGLDRLPEASQAGRRALALWHGPALSGLSGSWVQLFREQLASERRAVAIQRFQVEMTLGRDADLLGELAEWETECPTDETIIGLHLLALYRTGQSAMVDACYRRAEHRMRITLSAPVGAALQALMRRIRAGDPALRTDPVLDRYRPSARGTTATAVDTVPPGGHDGKDSATARQLPAAARQFVCRLDELAALTEVLRGGLVAAIGGSAGIGKTTLAVYWAHQVAGHFPDGQLYVNLRGFDPSGTPVTPQDALRGFLEALGVDPKRMPGTLDALSAQYRSRLAGRRVLVLLDNASDPAQVRPLLPGSDGCLTVITSRAMMAGLVAAEGAFPLTLDLLSPQAARELLTRRLGAERMAAEPGACDELIELCAGLPLALSVAAARVTTHPHLPIGALVTQLRSARTRLDALESGDDAVSVRAVFSWSYRCLSDPAARLFRLLCLPPGPDIGLAAAASLAGLGPDETAPILDEIVSAHLVAEIAPRRYAVHDLLREYARERAQCDDSEAQRAAAIDRLLDHYLHTAHAAALLVNTARVPLPLAPPRQGVTAESPGDRIAALAWFEAERRVLRATIGYAADRVHLDAAWQLAWCLADFYNQRGYWHDWVAAQELALAAAERLADPAALARCHQYLGYVHVRIHHGRDDGGHLGQALRLYRQLGDDAGLASTHAMMAIAAEQQGRYRDGLGHTRKAARLRERLGQPGPLANSLNMLGWFYALLGEYDRAIAYCEEALRLHRELGNGNGEAATWDSLGYAHYHSGRCGEAVQCFEHAVDLNERLGDRYQLALNLKHLGDAHTAAGAGDAALAAWQRALAIFTELDHPHAATVRAKLEQPSPSTQDGDGRIVVHLPGHAGSA